MARWGGEVLQQRKRAAAAAYIQLRRVEKKNSRNENRKKYSTYGGDAGTFDNSGRPMLLIKKEGPAARPRARSIRRFPIFMQEQGHGTHTQTRFI